MANILKISILTILVFIIYSPKLAKAAEYWSAEQYEAYISVDQFWANRFLMKNHTFRGNENILYIGSGDGASAAYIARTCPKCRVIGSEVSPKLVDDTKSKYKSITNLSFVLNDIIDPSFYEEHKDNFDVIVSFFILNWVDNQKTILDGIWRSLKIGGKFYLRLAPKEKDPIGEIADNLMSNEKYKEYFIDFADQMKYFSTDEVKALLKSSSLSIISITQDYEQRKLEDVGLLMDEIKNRTSQYHYLKNLNPAIAQQYIEDITIAYNNRYPPKIDGTIILYSKYIEVVGSVKHK